MLNSSPGLIDILRSVLRRLEDDAQFAPDDPAVVRFKQRVLRSIAQLELQRSSLKAPDIIVPGPEPQKSGQQQHSHDSVVVLVARHPDKSNDDGGESSAA